MTTVTIRKGFAAILLSLLWTFFGGYILIGYLSSFFVTTEDFTFLERVAQFVFALLVGGGFLYIAASIFRQKYIISLDGIEITRLFNKRFVGWDEIEIMNSIPTFAGAENFKLFLYNGESVTLFTAFMAHYERSAKALIEASHEANPDIEFNFFTVREYGRPPYGIFKREGLE